MPASGREPRGARRLQAHLHAAQHADQRLVGDAEPVAQVHALRPHTLADMGVQEPVADRGRKLAAVIALDQRHHHVERRDAARAGDAVAVDLEQRRHDLDIGKGLAESRQMLPMQRRAALIEQPGLGEDVGPAGDAADGDTLPREPPEPGEHAAVVEDRGIAAGADEDHVGRPIAVGAAIGDDGDAVRGHNRLAAGRRVPPAIKLLAGEQIGGAQRLDRRGVGHQREARHQQEADPSAVRRSFSRCRFGPCRKMSSKRREMSISSDGLGARWRSCAIRLAAFSPMP